MISSPPLVGAMPPEVQTDLFSPQNESRFAMRKALVIEKDDLLRKTYRSLLEELFHYQVVTTADVQQGLFALSAEIPDIILIDADLLSYPELQRLLAGFQIRGRPPGVILTIYPDTRPEFQDLRHPALSGILKKPFDSIDLERFLAPP
jgi:DNA-binding NarL/FixJ family response regulator